MASNRTFRKLKSADEETQLPETAVPKSTRGVTEWSMKIFSEWQGKRLTKKASDEQGYSVDGSSEIRDLDINVCNMSAETLNFWLAKFVMDMCKEGGECFPLERFIVFVVVFNAI
jgi:hypothetical protein